MLSLYKGLKFSFRYLVPAWMRYFMARAIARGVVQFNPKRRAVIIQNLIPLVGAERAERLAPELLGHFSMTAVDFFCARENMVRAVTHVNWSILDKTYRRSKRVILVTGHIGNWELGISCMVGRGFMVSGVYAPYRDNEIVKWILAHRQNEVEWIPAARGAAEACLSALQRGRILGMVADIPFGEKGHRVPLAGAQAYLPLGPWGIAVRARATVIPGFVIRERPGHYRSVLHDPIFPPADGSFRRQMETMQESYRSLLEQYLKQYPTQWGVLQPFWAAPPHTNA